MHAETPKGGLGIWRRSSAVRESWRECVHRIVAVGGLDTRQMTVVETRLRSLRSERSSEIKEGKGSSPGA